LIVAAIEAEARLRTPHRMHILTGPHAPAAVVEQLNAAIANRQNLRLERHTTRFLALLHQAALSISMAGYNTCMDILSAKVQALVYPFAGPGNEEQAMRARKLEQLGLVHRLDSQSLDPIHLAAEIERRLALPQPIPAHTLDLNGAAQTRRMLAALLDEDGSAP
jgi:predicted glycosyltransferase